MIQFACIACNREMRAKDEYAGCKSKCPGCGAILIVPLKAIQMELPPATPEPPSRRDEEPDRRPRRRDDDYDGYDDRPRGRRRDRDDSRDDRRGFRCSFCG